MEWDEVVIARSKTLEFPSGADLTAFKDFVATKVPDVLGPKQTASITIIVVSHE